MVCKKRKSSSVNSKKNTAAGSNLNKTHNTTAPPKKSNKQRIWYVPPSIQPKPSEFRANDDQNVLILQNLIPYLDHRRLLKCRYVSKTFNSVIRSVKLKYLTFNRHDNDDDKSDDEDSNKVTPEDESITKTSNSTVVKGGPTDDNFHVTDYMYGSISIAPNVFDLKDEPTNDELHETNIEDESISEYSDEPTDEEESKHKDSTLEQKKEVLAKLISDTKFITELVENICLGKYALLALEKNIFSNYCNLKSVKFAYFPVKEALLLQGLKHLNRLTQLEFQKFTVIGNGEAGPLHEPVSLPSSLTKLNMFDLRLKDDPISFILTLAQLTEDRELTTSDSFPVNIQELTTAKLSHRQLIEPFFSESSDLTKLDFSFKNKLNSYRIMHDLFVANRHISDLHLRFKTLTQDAIDIIKNHLPELKSLTLTNFPSKTNYYHGWFLNPDVSLSSPMQLTTLKMDFNGLRSPSLNSLLSNLPNLTKLFIKINNYEDEAPEPIVHNCPLLTWLTIKYPSRFLYESADVRVLSCLFDLTENHVWKCASNLRVLSLVNLDILKFQPSYLNNFDDIQVINFYRSHRSQSTRYLGDRLQEHLDEFKNYQHILHKSASYRSGYLYKPLTTYKFFDLD